MTWSIIAKDPETGAFGVAVTTKFFAVGALCPYGAAQIGALATQALVNPLYGHDGMRLLAEGRSAEDIVAILTAGDPGREVRQLHVIDREGRTARPGSAAVRIATTSSALRPSARRRRPSWP